MLKVLQFPACIQFLFLQISPYTLKSFKMPENETPNLPWVEKYRPNALEDLISHEDIISTIRTFISQDKLPHLLFYGPPGTGKTSTILACAKEIYPAKQFNSMVSIINIVAHNSPHLMVCWWLRFSSRCIWWRSSCVFALTFNSWITGTGVECKWWSWYWYSKRTDSQFCLHENYF